MNEVFQLGILGGGESGVASALLGKEKNINVFLSEKGKLEHSNRIELIEAGISFEEGQHSLDKLLNSDAIIKSPGIRSNISIIQNTRKAGIPIWSDIEWFFRNKPCLLYTSPSPRD